jgi:hypothetical protein
LFDALKIHAEFNGAVPGRRFDAVGGRRCNM